MIKTHITRREQRRHTKEERWKEAQRLNYRRYVELRKIEEAGREEVELDEPLFLGWERYFVVREDLRRSPDGPYLERILALIQHVEPCDRRGVRKERDYKRGSKLREVKHFMRTVDATTYWLMTAKMRACFEPHVLRRQNYFTKKQEILTVFVVAQPWKFTTRVRERWRTHEIVQRNNVDEERQLIDGRLWGCRGHNSYPFGYVWQHGHNGRGPRFDFKCSPHANNRQAPIVEQEGK